MVKHRGSLRRTICATHGFNGAKDHERRRLTVQRDRWSMVLKLRHTQASRIAKHVAFRIGSFQKPTTCRLDFDAKLLQAVIDLPNEAPFVLKVLIFDALHEATTASPSDLNEPILDLVAANSTNSCEEGTIILDSGCGL